MSYLALVATSTVTLVYKGCLMEMATKCWGKPDFEMEDDENSISDSPTFQEMSFYYWKWIMVMIFTWVVLGGDSFYQKNQNPVPNHFTAN